jgi:iron complex transport system permease protein
VKNTVDASLEAGAAQAAAVAGRKSRRGLTRSEKRSARMLVILGALALAIILAYQFYGVKASWSFTMELRVRQILSMVLVGCATAFATVLFQTITNNRILTPSVMGFDSMFVFIQTVVVFFFGISALDDIHPWALFGVQVFIMMSFALLLFRWLFGKNAKELYVLVLVGIILGTLLSSLSGLAQRMIDPNEYTRLQDKLFASFNTVNDELLWFSAALMIGMIALSIPLLRKLDVVALGRERAIALGVEHQRTVYKALIVVSVLVSVSTALVGPITFLGLLVANLARELVGTFKHKWTIPAACFISIIAVVGGQFILARLMGYNSVLIVVINFVGGIYFISLLLRGARL